MVQPHAEPGRPLQFGLDKLVRATAASALVFALIRWSMYPDSIVLHLCVAVQGVCAYVFWAEVFRAAIASIRGDR